MDENGDILKKWTVGGNDLSTIKQVISHIRRHSVWKTELFSMHYDLTMRIANWFSLSCVLWYCSIARWNEYVSEMSIRMAALSRAWVCDCSFAGIGVLISTEGMEISFLRVLCFAKYRFQRRADHLSGGALPKVLCLSSVKREAVNRILAKSLRKRR